MCDSDWWCKYGNSYQLFNAGLTVTITDEDDPANNFEVWSRVDYDQEYGDGMCVRAEANTLLYKVESDEDV